MIWILLLILISSAAGTITGFGTSTLMLPILIMSYPVADALFFVSVIHFFNALWRLILFNKGFDLKLVISFGLTGIIAAYFGAKVFFMIDEALITKVMAGFLMIYAIFLWRNPHFKINFSWSTGIFAGLSSGFIAGLFGMGGTIRAAFLAAFDLPKLVYLANSALLLMMIDISRLIAYLEEGVSINSLLGLSYIQILLCIVVSFFGVKLGDILVNKIPQEKFRLVVSGFLLIVAVKLITS